MNGWYYENRGYSDKVFKKVSNINEANILIACYKDSMLTISPEKYAKMLKTNMDTILKNAQKNPQEKYFILIDKTFNPLFQSIKDTRLPSNVEVIETMSITKYQRGETNHFFGIVSRYGEKIDPITVD